MTNQIQTAARSRKIGRGTSAPRKDGFQARPRPAAGEIDSGVRVRCQELSADLAVIRFECGTRPAAPARAAARRAARPSGAS
jgi:hypothetical protein